MRGGKSFLILVALALGLGAYIYFVEMKREPGDASLKKPDVFTVDTEKVEEVELRSAAGSVTTLKKNGALWQIVAPETLDADEAEISSVLSTLKSLEVQRTLEEKPASVAAYGLEPPRMTVGFRAGGETAMQRLQIGNKTPTGGDLYARIEGQPQLFLISAYLEDSLNKTTFALRDKSVLKFARENVDSLTTRAARRRRPRLRQEGGGLAVHQAPRRQGRLQRRRRHRRPAVTIANEVSRRQ